MTMQHNNISSATSPELFLACEFDHSYPCTKILWSPEKNTSARDLVATTGDYLRIWNLSDDGSGNGTLIPKKEVLLNNVSYLCINQYVERIFILYSPLSSLSKKFRTKTASTAHLSHHLTGMKQTQISFVLPLLIQRVQFGTSQHK